MATSAASNASSDILSRRTSLALAGSHCQTNFVQLIASNLAERGQSSWCEDKLTFLIENLYALDMQSPPEAFTPRVRCVEAPGAFSRASPGERAGNNLEFFSRSMH